MLRYFGIDWFTGVLALQSKYLGGLDFLAPVKNAFRKRVRNVCSSMELLGDLGATGEAAPIWEEQLGDLGGDAAPIWVEQPGTLRLGGAAAGLGSESDFAFAFPLRFRLVLSCCLSFALPLPNFLLAAAAAAAASYILSQHKRRRTQD